MHPNESAAGRRAGDSPQGPAAGRLSGGVRLLVLERPGPARQSLVALAKVLGVEDVTVVECTSDAFAALENAPFDAFIYDADDPPAPVGGLVTQMRNGGLGPRAAATAVIAKSRNAKTVEDPALEDPDAAPHHVLATPVHVDRLFGLLAQAAAPAARTRAA